MPIKDQKAYNEYMREYMLKRYHKQRKTIIAEMGGECTNCGSKKKLQVDHIKPNKKKFTVAKEWSKNPSAMKKELKKCQLLCEKCHQLKTMKQNGMKPAKGTHGTLSSYRYCKCVKCKAAKALYMKTYKRKRN